MLHQANRGVIMATLYEGARAPLKAPRKTERYNADMRLWMRVMLWATRNCGQ
jgi:hypothetical protein